MGFTFAENKRPLSDKNPVINFEPFFNQPPPPPDLRHVDPCLKILSLASLLLTTVSSTFVENAGESYTIHRTGSARDCSLEVLFFCLLSCRLQTNPLDVSEVIISVSELQIASLI